MSNRVPGVMLYNKDGKLSRHTPDKLLDIVRASYSSLSFDSKSTEGCQRDRERKGIESIHCPLFRENPKDTHLLLFFPQDRMNRRTGNVALTSFARIQRQCCQKVEIKIHHRLYSK